MNVVTNAGPLMVLGKLNLVHLLPELYDTVFVPAAVYDEVVISGFAHGHPDAYVVKYAFDRGQLQLVHLGEADLEDFVQELPLGRGEIHVIQLALMRNIPLALLDDKLARDFARSFGIKVKGSIGVLIDAYRQQILSVDELSFALEEIKQRSDIWISSAFVDKIWHNLMRD